MHTIYSYTINLTRKSASPLIFQITINRWAGNFEVLSNACDRHSLLVECG